MNYYYFGGGDLIKREDWHYNQVAVLEECGFSGVLFTYAPDQGDFFTRVSRDIDLSKKIKYMLAIRAHAISPQYLTMLSQGVEMIQPHRLQINLISGHIKEHEKSFGGILGTPNDLSSNIDRSNHLIDYMKELDNMRTNNSRIHQPDIFVTTTNKFVYETASNLGFKMIIAYREYKQGRWTVHSNYQSHANHLMPGEPFDFTNNNVMISVSPVIRKTQKEIDALDKPQLTNDTEYFTYESFYHFVKKLESQGINHLMMHGWPEPERQNIMNFIKFFTSIGVNV